MEPVLKRADSVKELSIQSAITYSSKAAESLDNALTVADKYVDKYLPEIDPNAGNVLPRDEVDHQLRNLGAHGFAVVPSHQNPTQKTIRHVNVFSRTLKRRLTQRTIYEARELKKQGLNIIQVLVHMTDLLARDPKAFVQKMKDLWMYLSQDEPENQAPPQNLEQLIVMLTREGARRFVHIANFISYNTVRIPQYASSLLNYAIHRYTEYVQSLNLSTKGIKRHAEILKHAIHDIFDQFISLIKPLANSSGEVKVPLQIKSGSSHSGTHSSKNMKNTEPKSPTPSENGGITANN
jgi:perilipin-2